MLRLALLLIAAALLGTAARAQESTPFTAKELAQGYRDGWILAKPKAAKQASVDTEESAEGWSPARKFSRFGGLRVLEVAAGDTADNAVRRLRSSGRYEYVEPDYIRRAFIAPSDPLFSQQWGLNNTGVNPNVPGPGLSGADIRAEAGWDIRTSASGVIVGVIDSGGYLAHQDLAGNLWVNSNPGQRLTYNVSGRNRTVTDSLNGLNAVVGSGPPNDDNGHGTHVSGIIGAVPNNNLGIAGVAWSVQLMELKFLDSTGAGDTVAEITCIDYAIAHGVSVINASYGSSSYSSAEYTAIQQAAAAGIIFVAAAGNSAEDNDLTPSYPAGYLLDNIVAVACSDNRDDSVFFTCYGSGLVDLYAPGYKILSLYNTGATATAVLSGTSMSTPFVTGSLALLKAQFPSDTYRQLINRLLSAVDTNANLLGKAQTGGRLNLARALASSANRPFNDNFAGRAHLAGTSVTVRSNNAGATREGAEPVIGGSSGGASLWWDWTAPATGAVTATTAGSAYATLLGVYTGTSLGTLSPVAASAASGAGASNVTFTAQAGTTYAIAVDGQNAATGLTALNLHYTNTAFASAITLSGASTAITGTTFASASPASLSHLSDYLVWFSWTAPKSAQFQVSASSYDFDPRLTVYTGSSASALTQVARSTAATIGANASTASTACLCTFWATAGTTYTFTVDGVGDANSLSGALDSSGLPVGGGQFALSTLDSRWQAITDDSITCSPAVGKDGTVYAGSVSGTFYAYNPDGTKKWSYASPTSGSFDTSSAAISSDGAAVYAGCGDQNLYALSTSTGSVLWAHTFGAAPACSPAVASDGTIYIRDSGGTFSALNPATGAAKWTFSIPGASYGAPVVASDGTIYIGSDNGSLYAITPAGTGATQKWTFAANQTIANDAIYTAPAIDAAGNLYFGTLGGTVYAVTSAGAKLWSYQTANSISSSPALGSSGTVYVASYDHKLYALNMATGALKWAYGTGGEIRASSPLVAAGQNGSEVVLVGTYDDKLYAINSDGTLNRIFAAGDWVRSSPAIFGTTLYFGSNDHKLAAVDTGLALAGTPWPMYQANPLRSGRLTTDALAVTLQPAATVSVQPGGLLTLTAAAVGQGPLSFQWQLNGVAIPGANDSTYVLANAGSAAAGVYTLKVSGPQGTTTSSASTVSIISPPSIATPPQAQTAAAGSSPVFSVSATGGALAYQWYFNGVAISGAASASLTLANVASIQAGTYSVVVSNGAGSASAAATLAVTTAARLMNVSARAFVGSTPLQALVAGFVVSGSSTKQVLIRGVGPTLSAYSVSGALQNPTLTLYDSASAVIGSQTGWATAPARGASSVTAALRAAVTADFTPLNAFALPGGSADCAMMAGLGAASYTAQITPASTSTGVALAELYDADLSSGAARLANLSSRAFVGTGTQVMVAGFVVSGTTSQTVLIRAVGPTLGQYGVTSPLSRPQLDLYDSNNAIIATNVGWGNPSTKGPSAMAAQTGLLPATASVFSSVYAFSLPTGSADCAMVVTLPPGQYTAQVSGVGGLTGISLAELYELR